MPKSSNTEWATIGKIVAPFGIRGELKVFSLSDIPDRFAQLDSVFVGPDHAPRKITTVRPYKGNMLILKFVGIDDATTAETLRNLDLSIPLDKLAKLPPNSYYQHDILGLRVAILNGREIGTIIEIMETGSNDVYVVKGENSKQILLPAIKDVVKQVDLIRRMMYIEPMAGLLDDDAVLDDPNESKEEEEE
ncbi:MAG: ribosome maturation factor RimM [Ktedonobacteraceae bacterium]